MASFQGTKINPKRFSRTQIKFYLILIPLSLFMLLPVVFIINQAFKPIDEIFRFPPTFIVQRPTMRNFNVIFNMTSATGVPMLRYLLNSVFVTLVTVVASVLITVMSAYALSKKKFKAKGLLLGINQAALMFVPVALQVPRYLIVVNIGLNNNFFAHILPLLAMPVGLFLVKQFMDGIPDSLLEAARIDGAGELRILFKVVFPLIKPAVSTLAILSFQQVWNSYESSNIYIIDESLKTLGYYLSSFSIQNNPAMAGVIAAAGLIMFLPNLIIFICMQSRVMNTMSHSGIK